MYEISVGVGKNIYDPMLSSLKLLYNDEEIIVYTRLAIRYNKYTYNYMPFVGIRYITSLYE